MSESVIALLDVDGSRGMGECVPRDYVTGESCESVLACLAALDAQAVARGLRLESFPEALRSVQDLRLAERMSGPDGRPALAAACVIELALADAVARRFGRSLAELAAALELPPELRQRSSVLPGKTRGIDFSPLDAEALAALSAHRPPHLKVKAGPSAAADVERVRTMREHLGPEVPISVDANMAWTLEHALAMVDALRPYAVAWYEEIFPRGDFASYRRFREQSGAKVMLDESVCSFADLEAAIAAEGCDLINIRISKCGGLLASAALAARAFQGGVGFQLGAQIGQTEILNAAGRRFVQAIGGAVAYEEWFPYEAPIVREAVVVDADFRWTVLPDPGLGVTPALDVIPRVAVKELAWPATPRRA